MREKYRKNDTFFDTWSPDMAYILGFIVADGNVGSNNNILSLTLSAKDVDVLEFIRSKLSPDTKIGRRSRDVNGKILNYVSFAIRSYKIIYSLETRGVVSRKTGKETIPDGIPEEFLGDFLRGLFDGDGCVGTDNGNRLIFMLCSASKTFLENLRFRFDNYGSICKHRGIWSWEIGAAQTIQLREILYKNAGFYLKRKRDKIFSVNFEDLKKHPFSKEEDIQIIKLANQGIGQTPISKTLNRNVGSVKKRIRFLRDRKLIPTSLREKAVA